MSIVLNAAIKKSLSDRGQLDIGQFHLLNMDMVKIAAGSGWPAMKKKIYQASSQFIEKRLRGDDMLIPCDEGFLLIFADASEEEAQHRMERLGVQLREFFLGTPVLSSLGVRCEAKTVSPNEFAELAGAMADASKAPKAIPLPEHPVFRPAFEPVWDAAKSVIAANILAPVCEVDGRDRLARDAVGARKIPTSMAELDVFSARTALAALRQLAQKQAEKQAPIPVRFSVHFETIFAADARYAYLDALSVAPMPMRRFFQLAIDCPPADRKDTIRVVRELREFGVRPVLETDLETPDLDLAEDCGVSLVALEAPRRADRDSDGLTDRHKSRLARFVESARAKKTWIHLLDVRDAKTVKDAAGCGVRFVSGPAVGGASEMTLPGKPYSLVDLVQKRRAA